MIETRIQTIIETIRDKIIETRIQTMTETIGEEKD
jgi:hypothetical protein